MEVTRDELVAVGWFIVLVTIEYEVFRVTGLFNFITSLVG